MSASPTMSSFKLINNSTISVYAINVEQSADGSTKATILPSSTGSLKIPPNQTVIIPFSTSILNVYVTGDETNTFIPLKKSAQLNGFTEDITVQAEDVTNSALAKQFFQAFRMYPKSKMAQDFLEILKLFPSPSDETSGPKPTLEQKINDYFKTTKNYKTLNANWYFLITTYAQVFPYLWVDQGNSQSTFYFYTSEKDGIVPAGTLSYSKATSSDGDAASYYSLSYTDTENKQIPLFYNTGCFLSDTLPFSLSATFLPSTSVFRSDTDSSPISVTNPPTPTRVFSGQISGLDVLGYEKAKNLPENPSADQQFLQLLLHPHGFKQIFESLMQWLGALMALEFVGKTLKGGFNYAKEKFAKPEAVPKEPANAVENIKEADRAVTAETKISVVETHLDMEVNRLKLVVEEAPGVTSEMQQVAEDIREQKAKLDAVDRSNVSDVESVATEAKSNLDETSSKLSEIADEARSSMSEDAQEQLNNQEAEIKDIQETQDNVEDTENGVEEGDFEPIEMEPVV